MNKPHPRQEHTIDRSMSGLRDALFDVMEKLRAGNIDANQAKAFAALALTAIKSVEVQIQYEEKRLASEIPGHLPEMKLIPPLKAINE